MKFNIEIDIGWIDNEDNLDDAIKRQLINGLSKKMENDFLGETGKLMAQAAEKLIKAKTEQLIYSVLENPCEVSTGWQQHIKYESIYDMVEKKMTALYQGKLNQNGQCTKDPLLANIEKYVEQHIGTKIRGIETTIDKYAKRHAANELKSNKLISSLQAIMPEIKQAIDK